MKTFTTSLKIAAFAIGSGLLAIFVVLVLIGIVSFVNGVHPLAGLYYIGMISVYIGVPAMLIGAIAGSIELMSNTQKAKEKANPVPKYISLGIGILLPVVIILGLMFYLYTNIDQDRNVVHGANWTVVLVEADVCSTELVQLVFRDYGWNEHVCSAALLSSLEGEDAELIPAVFRATSDFGEVRAYQLIEVNGIAISWDDWVHNVSCQGDCDGDNSRHHSFLLESSWHEE